MARQPTLTPPSLAGKVVVSNSNKKVPLLGFFVWFSVPDDDIKLTTLKLALARQGLPPDMVPKNTRAKDVFQRAMRKQDGRHKQDDGTVVENEVAIAVETPEDLVYQISVMLRDVDEQVIDYVKGVRVIFNKRTEQIHFNFLEDEGIERKHVMAMRHAIRTYYEDNNKVTISGSRVRAIVRDYLSSEPDERKTPNGDTKTIHGLSGTNLREKAGGLYFVPVDFAEEVKALSEVLPKLFPPGERGGRFRVGGYVHALPMADGKGEREIIEAHHMANIKNTLWEATSSARDLMEKDRLRDVRSNVISDHWADLRQIKRQADRYRKLLKAEDEDVTLLAETLEKQLRRLQGRPD